MVQGQRDRDKKQSASGFQGDLCNALFHAGFSTRDYINQFSGRVWGMAALKEACSELGGRLGELEDWSRGPRFLSLSPRQQFCLRRLEDKSTLY